MITYSTSTRIMLNQGSRPCMLQCSTWDYNWPFQWWLQECKPKSGERVRTPRRMADISQQACYLVSVEWCLTQATERQTSWLLFWILVNRLWLFAFGFLGALWSRTLCAGTWSRGRSRIQEDARTRYTTTSILPALTYFYLTSYLLPPPNNTFLYGSVKWLVCFLCQSL